MATNSRTADTMSTKASTVTLPKQPSYYIAQINRTSTASVTKPWIIQARAALPATSTSSNGDKAFFFLLFSVRSEQAKSRSRVAETTPQKPRLTDFQAPTGGTAALPLHLQFSTTIHREGSISASGRSGTRSRRTMAAAWGAGGAPAPSPWRRRREPGSARARGGPEPRRRCRRRPATAPATRPPAARRRSRRRGSCSGQRRGGAAQPPAAAAGGWCWCRRHRPDCLTEEREHAEGPGRRPGWRRPHKLQRLRLKRCIFFRYHL